MLHLVSTLTIGKWPCWMVPSHVFSFRWGTILSFIYCLFVFHRPAELRYGTIPVRLREVYQGAVEVRRGVRLLRQLGRGRLQRRWVSDQINYSLPSPLWGCFGVVRFRFEERKGKRINQDNFQVILFLYHYLQLSPRIGIHNHKS